MLAIQHCGHMKDDVYEAEGLGGDMLAMSGFAWALWAIVVLSVLLALDVVSDRHAATPAPP